MSDESKPTEPKVQPGYALHRDDNGLTSRERQVLAMLQAGHSQASIARDMNLTRSRIGLVVKQLRAKGIPDV